MNIFVGNLLFEATESDVRKLFEGFGAVISVAIVMDKKGTRSRGFGFVDMPNDEEAKAAIAALHEKEFMGRALNVEFSLPKTEEGRDERNRKRMQLKVNAEAAKNLLQEKVQQAPLNPDFKTRGGRYKTGRRALSFMKKQSEAGLGEQLPPRRRNQDNPMRWRKRPKTWQKPEGEAKPWEKRDGERKPWTKREGEAKPWQKREGARKPWVKREGESKPWEKARPESKPWEKSEGKPRPWKKSEGEAKPWAKREGGSKPWEKARPESRPWEKSEGPSRPRKKPAGESKSWKKHKEKLAAGSGSKRPARPGFKGTSSSGGYTKRRKKI